LVGGSFTLSQLTDIRYKVAKHRGSIGVRLFTIDDVTHFENVLIQLQMNEEDIRIYKRNKKSVVDEYNEMKDNLDIDSWENVRGPRPWEADEQKYKDIIEKRIEDSETKKKSKGSFWAA